MWLYLNALIINATPVYTNGQSSHLLITPLMVLLFEPCDKDAKGCVKHFSRTNLTPCIPSPYLSI